MTTRKRRSDRSGRAKLHSPGRPDAARREILTAFWAEIATGAFSEVAATAAGVSPAVGARWLGRAGGMTPTHLAVSAPPPTGRYLSFEKREDITLGRASGLGVRDIARRLCRAPSTISREIRRNAATRSGGLEYRATAVQWRADRSARRPKPSKLATNAALRAYVEVRLAGWISAPGGPELDGPTTSWKGRRHGRRQPRSWARAWSPEQISRRLRLDCPEDPSMRISHEAIYQALFVRSRGGLRRDSRRACGRGGPCARRGRAWPAAANPSSPPRH